MAQVKQFRLLLPALQVALAISFGGWGEWLRVSLLNKPFWGSSTWWDTTARFHVWPWPLKFAIVMNLPVLVGGALISVPLDAFHLPAAPEWLSYVMMLPFVALFWYWIGIRLDRARPGERNGESAKRRWPGIFLFMATCALISYLPDRITLYTDFVPFGVLLWLFATLVALRLLRSRTIQNVSH